MGVRLGKKRGLRWTEIPLRSTGLTGDVSSAVHDELLQCCDVNSDDGVVRTPRVSILILCMVILLADTTWVRHPTHCSGNDIEMARNASSGDMKKMAIQR